MEFALQLRYWVGTENYRLNNDLSSRNEEIRILCIGDSVSDSYPPHLQKLLDKSASKHKFKVIRHTKSFLRIKEVYDEIDELLIKYKPHHVVLMIGKTAEIWGGGSSEIKWRNLSFRSSRLIHLIINYFDEIFFRL